MDLFKLVGSIFINNSDANSEIDKTAEKGKGLAQSLGSSMKDVGGKITNVGKSLAPVSLAVGAVFGASVKGASDFNNGMAKVSTLVDTTKVDINELSNQFLELSNQTGKSATELAEAGYQALSASVPVEKLGKFTETATNLAKVGFTDSATAVDVLTTAINAYGLQTEEADSLATKLVKTQNMGKTTVAELASSMGKIIPTASGMGVNIDNLTAGYVTLTKQGIATAESTTYMNSMLNELGDSSTDVGGILKEQTGKSFQELMADGYSLGDVLQILKDNADETGTNFNELWGSQEAGKSALAIVNSGTQEFNDTVKKMSEDTNELAEGLEKLNTPSAKAQKALNQLKNSGIELGTAFLSAVAPAIDALTKGIGFLTGVFNKLPTPVKTVIAVIMGIITVLSPVLIIIGTVISSIGSIITILPTLSAGLGVVSGAFSSLGAVLLANPIGIVIAVIGALIAILVHLWNTNEGFRNAVITAWTNIKEKASEIWTAVKETFTSVWTSITEFVSSAWETIKNVIQVGVMLIGSILQGAFDIITLPFRFIWENCKETLIQIWDTMSGAVSEKVSAIYSVVSEKIEAVRQWVSEKFDAVASKTSEIWTSIKDKISEHLEAIRQWVSEKLDAVHQKFSEVWETIKGVVDEKINAIKDGINDGINTAKGILDSVLDAIGGKFSEIFENAKQTVQNAIEFIKGLFNFEWHLPDIALPHFSIDGEFSLNPPSVPHLAIDWYKKAVQSPYMFTDPTLFGINPLTGAGRVAGEAGDEIMYGHQNLMQDISSAVRSETGGLEETIKKLFEQLFRILEMYFPQFTQDIVLDDGTLVGRLAPRMDEELGKLYKWKDRS